MVAPGAVHSLTLLNERAELARMAVWIDGIASELRLAEKTAHAMHVCLEEAVVNIISYAFEPGTLHDVQLALRQDDAGLHVEVSDDGRPFHPLAHEPPPAAEDLETARIGGLGITLMKSFASGLAYRRCGGLNRLTLSFSTQ